MLLPSEIKPETSVYYYSAILLKTVKSSSNPYNIIDLYNVLKEKLQISLRNYAYCLDWLFLIDAVIINDEGSVVLCT
ncbi:TPA: hypothetical protein NR394_001461 [Listeria innocua]|uniref:ABC-three component system middle component 6 n=1 Tax=Listeria monocytogenes TaxID=1639 RepID=UPI00164B68CE|nr:ABC-three component system middle component 6 [Listeria monocytogenes]EKE9634680.1 hypothetical protein [Listeria innocua]EHB3414026.1 hypothetical protein [Listeria monocytogenes]EKE9670224.1 hypothetical protein [Listeria innocua]QNK11222.1 uncharacterized protein LMMT_0815 [Listeria monocytogenes]QNK22680.1 uncharacterized protein LMUH4_0858 [Listeria monocytogenes]